MGGNFEWMLSFQIYDGKYIDRRSLSFSKHCIALKFDGLNFDGLAGKCQKHQNFLLYGTFDTATQSVHTQYIMYNVTMP